MNVRGSVGASAFSLVEVVIAMAVMSFALIGILGFIPDGLQHLKNAMNMSAETRIMQSVASSMEETYYTNMSSVSTNYYDDEGNSLAGQTSPGCIYTAVVNVTNETLIPGDATSSTNLATINVIISNVSQPNRTTTNSELIARMIE